MKARLLGIIFVFVLPLALSRAQIDGPEYIVMLKGGHSIESVNKTHGTRTVRKIPNDPIYLVKTDIAGDDALRRLKEDVGIEIAEKNDRARLTSGDAARLDPLLARQTASTLDAYTLTTFYGTAVLKSYADQPAVHITRLNEARSLSTGAATRVAYIDTGVDFTHPALSPWLDPGIDLVFNRTASELDGLAQEIASAPSQQMPSPLGQQMASLLDDRFSFILNQAMASLLDGNNAPNAPTPFPSALGHGTLVAGMIHLFAPESRIVPIKAFDAYGNTTMFTIIEALYRARDLNVDVINMSFSITQDSDLLSRAIVEIYSRGIALVASVGNDASEASRIYPASYALVIGVAATDFNDRLASFSSYGRSVSISAPGAFVVSTVPGGRYAAAWGTSFSAPIVSGTVALIASGRGQGYADLARAITTADYIDYLNPGFERKLGRGRVNVRRSLMPGPNE
jgi:subtilisin family serine protease